MKIDNQQVQVSPLPFDEHGERIEPEQQPAKIIQTGSAPLTLGGGLAGALPINIEQHLTAGALAATLRDPCSTCKNFDRTTWLKQLKVLRSSHEGRGAVNAIMAGLLGTNNVEVEDMHRGEDGEFDTDHAVASLGICRILTEVHNDMVVVHPLGVCPNEMRSYQKPRGAYEAKGRDEERAGSAAFDVIMRAAEKGKI